MIRDIHEAILELRNGSFFRIGFVSDVDTSASWKKQNKDYRMIKVTEMTARTGINYGKLVPASDSFKNSVRKSNFSSVIKNKVSYNSNTNLEYMNLYPTKKGKNVKTYFALLQDGKEVKTFNDVNDIKDAITGSYYKKNTEFNGEPSKMIRVKLDNVYKINNEVW